MATFIVSAIILIFITNCVIGSIVGATVKLDSEPRLSVKMFGGTVGGLIGGIVGICGICSLFVGIRAVFEDPSYLLTNTIILIGWGVGWIGGAIIGALMGVFAWDKNTESL